MSIQKVSIAILSWNGLKHLKHCLPALREQHDPGVDTEILGLDNGSWDDSADWVREHHPEVRLIESKVNLGFCGGNNRLVEEATGDAIALLNNDTRPQPQWLAALVDALKSADDDVAAVSGLIIDWEGERLDFAGGLVTFDGHAFQRDYYRPLSETTLPKAGAELPFPCGGNMLIRREAYLEAGGFDSDYFAYLEDVDLGWRLWSGGARVTFAPEAVVHHRSMATSKMLGNANRGFLFERNAFLTAYRNLDDDHWRALSPTILLTLSHRTQTLLVQNNPGGELLTLDPYAGWIANTAHPDRAEPSATPEQSEPSAVEQERNAKPTKPSPLRVEDSIPETTLKEKWRGYGPKDFFRRGVRKAARLTLPNWLFEEVGPPAARLTDDRTVAQFRVLTQLWGHLDRWEASRHAIQKRRQRSDREILERFPLYIIPTYPGDESLFASETFRGWLPEDVPLVHETLEDVMSTS